jgi:hypothetical protein
MAVINVTVRVHVDMDAYNREYGLKPGDVRVRDIKDDVKRTLEYAVDVSDIGWNKEIYTVDVT